MVLILRGRQVQVRVVDVGRDIDEYGADQRLSAAPVIGPEPKKGRGHHLTQAVGSHHPAKKTGICSTINLRTERDKDNILLFLLYCLFSWDINTHRRDQHI